MYIGIDYGTKRVGIAVSDEAGKLAFPLEVVPTIEALERVIILMRERKVNHIVIGESRSLSGKENPVATAIRTFVDRLIQETGARVHFEPEFFTSAQAARRDQGKNPRNARSRPGATGTVDEQIDASAAALILQSFLDKDAYAKVAAVIQEKNDDVPATSVVSIDEFHKIDIRVGEIKSAERIPETEKLLRLIVSFGTEERQIVSGIAKYFPNPEVLVDKKVAFAYNLAPRIIRGLESQGMIMAAHDDNGFSLLEAPNVAPGTRVG